MFILLIIIVAIIVAKWLGCKWNREERTYVRRFFLLIIFLLALFIPLCFGKFLMKHGYGGCMHTEPFVGFLVSALLFVFFLYNCCDNGGVSGEGQVIGPIFEKPDPADRDKFKKIEGIGPKIQQLLYDAGLYTFDHLSQVDHGYIKQILMDAGDNFRQHDPVTRPLQAKMAHEGKRTQLKKRQDELKGGRL